MNKQPDFGTDLATLNDNVTAEVGDVLQALEQKRTASRRPIVSKKEEPAAEPPQVTADNTTAPEQPAATSSSRRPRSSSRSRLTVSIEHEEPVENVTTRLRRKTNELLTESALRQRLKKEHPATRQDIIEAALTDWFRKHGYQLNSVVET